MRRGILVGVLAVGVIALWLSALAQHVLAGSGSSLLDISTDGKLLACTNRDSGTVTIVALPEHQKLHEIPVGQLPEGVAFLGGSHQLAVAVYRDDKVVLVDGDKGEVTAQVDVFDEPYGVVSTQDGNKIFVTLDFPGRVLEIDTNTKQVTRDLSVGRFTRGIALTPDEQRLLVTEYYTSNVIALDVASGKEVDRWEGISTDNLARQIIVHPTRPKAYLTHIRSRVTVAHGEGSIHPYVSIIDTRPAKEDEVRRKRMPMDSFLGALVTANPWDCAISPDGKQFYVVFAGTDDMFACDVIDDDYREIKYRKYMPNLGKNPRAVRVSPDNQTFYVYTALDFRVTAYDAKSLRAIGRVDVTEYPKSEEMLRGKVLFYSALQPMASRRWISCSSCHPDGEPDGRTWQNPEGLRNTQSLAGMAWTHPIHWSADRDEVQDFEHTIRGKLMQGRGLLNGDLAAELGDVNSGRSKDLDALAVYSNSHTYPLSPFAKKGLSESAQRGKEIFFAKETRCAECHSGPMYADSVPRSQILRHDVGTGGDDPSEKMGPLYDTPTLLGVYRTAPYLHHGKAETLEEVLTKCNPDDRHGKTSHLSPDNIKDLVEFLKALPYEDPEPAATAAGLTKVEKMSLRSWHQVRIIAILAVLSLGVIYGCENASPPVSGTSAPPSKVASPSKVSPSGDTDEANDSPEPAKEPSSEDKAAKDDKPAATSTPIQLDIASWEETQAIIAKHKGKVVVIDLWSTFCTPCIKEFPNLVAIHEKYGDEVVCLSLNCNYSGADTHENEMPAVVEFLASQKANFQNLMNREEDMDLYKKVGIASIPVVQVYGRDGLLAKQFDNEKEEYGKDGFTYEKDIVPFVESLLKAE